MLKAEDTIKYNQQNRNEYKMRLLAAQTCTRSKEREIKRRKDLVNKIINKM